MKQELVNLRKKMQEHNLDAYLIPTTDFHGSEYVNDYFKCREFISGFDGSAGTLLVTCDRAYLWTDGRYFLQAEAQLANTGIELMKMGEPGVPTIETYISEMKEGTRLGFDGRVVCDSFIEQLPKTIFLSADTDLTDEIRTDRPPLTPTEIYPLPDAVTGESSVSKLFKVRSMMKEKGADYHLITKLEQIAWLYNLRGSDVANTPVFYAFVLITPDEDRLYTLNEEFDGRKTFPYFQIFDDLKALTKGKILLCKDTASYSLVKAIPADVEIINGADPAELLKAIKNETEITATKNAHLKDGTAMVNFLYLLKTNIGKIPMSEISVSDCLTDCRKSQGCLDNSFDTISGYMENGAIVHYSATPETNKAMNSCGLLLIDSGGQYKDGTTDITRTIALGPVTEQMKRDYTAVLRAHIHLAVARFSPGTTGAELDKTARKPLRELGLDYNHGTGHGVGHLLSVHEGPNTISPRGAESEIMPGMITTDEPGVYLEGQYGIRLENELLCREDKDGKRYFEYITFCPFDRDVIQKDMLTADELNWLNDYHRAVYEHIAPCVSDDVRAWLKDVTREI